MKLFIKILFLVLAMVSVTFVAAYLTLPSLPDLTPLKSKANEYDVEILRDDWGTPHVYGKRDMDTAFGLGYAQSEDDFATLQGVVLATRGTLAAQIGPKAAKTDFVVQYMGVWDAVDKYYDAKVPAHIKQIAQAYADGVNVYAAQNPQKVSRYLLPVTAKDLIAGFTFKTPMFYGFDKALGHLVDPDEPHEIAKSQQDALTIIPAQNLPIGSQGIAIAPNRSEEGSTHLLVNSHQPLTGPVAWYEARLHSEDGWNIVGSTFPGAPVIIHGHNEHLGWSNTVNKPDLVDFYKLKINPENDNEYLLDGQWQTFEHKTASMLVTLFGPLRWTFTKDIKISQHGPVMETEHGWYAARWAGMEEVRTLEFMYDMNKARNQKEFENVLAMNAMPSINYVYADKEGNIAHYYNAKFPKRIEGWDWKKVLPGDRSELIWQGYRDFTMMPKTVNPKSGFVYNANNPPFMSTDGDDDAKPDDYPASMGIETFVTSRALQIETLAKKENRISLTKLKHIKFDNAYHPKSHQIQTLNTWLTNINTEELNTQEQQALQQLKNWNLKTDKNNSIAALAVLTIEPIQKANGEQVKSALITQHFKQAVADLIKYHGSINVAYGEVFRLIHGDKNLAISGGPDTLRAVYGKALNDQGQAENRAGDGYMMFVSWDKNGAVYSEAVHQYGSATQDENSSHFNDQMEMFVDEQLRLVPFALQDLAGQVTRRYRPGQPETRLLEH